jgi:phosphatidylglycerophosphatase A
MSDTRRAFFALWHTPAGLIATAAGAGLMPVAPGTAGSLVGLGLGWLAASAGGIPALIALAAILGVAGVWASSAVIRATGVEDPGPVVIDEVAGQIIALALVPLTWQGALTAFVLFRACDILKPWPASWFDTHVPGGIGAMGDDIVAGIYAMLLAGLFAHLAL